MNELYIGALNLSKRIQRVVERPSGIFVYFKPSLALVEYASCVGDFDGLWFPVAVYIASEDFRELSFAHSIRVLDCFDGDRFTGVRMTFYMLRRNIFLDFPYKGEV